MRASIASLCLLLVGCPAGADSNGATSGTDAVGTTTESPSGTGASHSEGGPTVDDTTEDGPSTDSDGPADSTSTTQGTVDCTEEFPAIVTDIDGTLTVADAEFLMQVDDGNYDPAERYGAHQMIAAYAELGYRVLYLTGRPEGWTIAVTNETAREVTERWLDEHEFPADPETTALVLAPRLLSGGAAQAFKAQAIMDLQAEGWRFDYAYGNTIVEIGGYEDAGIPKDATFIIGSDGGMGGTVAVNGRDWSGHANAHIPTVPRVCGASE